MFPPLLTWRGGVFAGVFFFFFCFVLVGRDDISSRYEPLSSIFRCVPPSRCVLLCDEHHVTLLHRKFSIIGRFIVVKSLEPRPSLRQFFAAPLCSGRRGRGRLSAVDARTSRRCTTAAATEGRGSRAGVAERAGRGDGDRGRRRCAGCMGKGLRRWPGRRPAVGRWLVCNGVRDENVSTSGGDVRVDVRLDIHALCTRFHRSREFLPPGKSNL